MIKLKVLYGILAILSSLLLALGIIYAVTRPTLTALGSGDPDAASEEDPDAASEEDPDAASEESTKLYVCDTTGGCREAGVGETARYDSSTCNSECMVYQLSENICKYQYQEFPGYVYPDMSSCESANYKYTCTVNTGCERNENADDGMTLEECRVSCVSINQAPSTVYG